MSDLNYNEFLEIAHERDAAVDRAEKAEAELETARMQIVACGVVALSDTPKSAKFQRDMHPDYRSASCDDVARRVDECIALRTQVAAMQAAIEEADRFLAFIVPATGGYSDANEARKVIRPFLPEPVDPTLARVREAIEFVERSARVTHTIYTDAEIRLIVAAAKGVQQ